MKVFLALLGFLIIAPLAAQDLKAPTLDTGDKQTISLVVEAAAKANSACQAIPEMQTFNGIRLLVNDQLEKKYPGFVLDWQSRTMKPKGAK